MKITGEKKSVAATDATVYSLVSNCNHFGKFVPEQITDWQSTETGCSFSAENIGKVVVALDKQIPYSHVSYKIDNDKNIPIVVDVFIEKQNNHCEVYLEIDLNLPFFMQPMVKKPLQQVADKVAEQIKATAEKI